MLAGGSIILAKLRRYKPLAVCFVGKQIGEVFCKEAARLEPVLVQESVKSEAVEKGGHGPGMQLKDLKGKKVKTKTSKKKPFEWGIQEFRIVHPRDASGLEPCTCMLLIV